MSKIPSLAELVLEESFPFLDSPVNPPPADHLPRTQYSNRERSELSFLLKPHDVLMFEEGLNIFRAAVQSSLVGKFLAENQIRKQTGCSVIAINTQGELNIVGMQFTQPATRCMYWSPWVTGLLLSVWLSISDWLRS